jgi:integrase
MGSIEKYDTSDGVRYRVRYRDPERKSREKGGFPRKRDAEEYLANVTVDAARGAYLDPGAAKSTIRVLGAEWLANQTHLKASTFRTVESAYRIHVEPFWGDRRIGDIRHSQVQAWITGLAESREATSVIRAHGILAGILDVAVLHRMAMNPARKIKLPRKVAKRREYLDHRQVELLAQSAGDHGTLVRFLAYAGPRWGEAIGLRIRNLKMLERRILVEENAVDVRGTIIVGAPKTHEKRSVPFPKFLAAELAIACEDKGREQLAFGDGDRYVRAPDRTSGWYARAIRSAQALDEDFPVLTIHDLRHTAASLAIAEHANVKAVQRMLGHASAAMTLDRYADLFDDDLEAVATDLDAARAQAVVGDLWGLKALSTPKTPEITGIPGVSRGGTGGI